MHSIVLISLVFGLYFFKVGVEGKTHEIRDLYSKVNSSVSVGNSYSDFFECTVGLKQGEVKFALLFALFIK